MSDLYGPGSFDDGYNDMNRTIDYLAHQNTRLGHENSELMDEVVAARAILDAIEALAAWFEAQPNWNEWGIHRNIRAALAGAAS